MRIVVMKWHTAHGGCSRSWCGIDSTAWDVVCRCTVMFDECWFGGAYVYTMEVSGSAAWHTVEFDEMYDICWPPLIRCDGAQLCESAINGLAYSLLVHGGW